jgi:type IV secretion system protein VirB3
MSELRKTPFYRALHRPQLILGGERIPMIASLVLSVGMAITSMNLVGLICGGLVALIAVFGLQMAAKADPFLIQIYLRYIRYKDYYPPFSRPSRVSNNPRVY